jgi:hypothetical protein
MLLRHMSGQSWRILLASFSKGIKCVRVYGMRTITDFPMRKAYTPSLGLRSPPHSERTLSDHGNMMVRL